MSYMKKLTNELILKRLLSETISEGLRHLEALRQAKPEHGATRHGEDMAVGVAADILASILPGVCPAVVRCAFESITDITGKGIWWGKGITERDIEFVMERIHQIQEATGIPD